MLRSSKLRCWRMCVGTSGWIAVTRGITSQISRPLRSSSRCNIQLLGEVALDADCEMAQVGGLPTNQTQLSSPARSICTSKVPQARKRTGWLIADLL